MARSLKLSRMRLALAAVAALALSVSQSTAPETPRVTVRLAPGVVTGPVSGRLLFMVSTDPKAEPRMQIAFGPQDPAGLRDRRRRLGAG